MPYSNLSFTVPTGLSYVAGDFVQFSYDANNFINGVVVSYNSSTGAMVITPTYFKGSGSYGSWTLNLASFAFFVVQVTYWAARCFFLCVFVSL